jgi:toxin ParE1/3/4
MMNRIIRRPAARRDIVDIVYHYIREGTPATASRFREQAEATLQRLAAMPGIGARYEHEHPALAELRYFPVSRFKKYLVFYRQIPDAIEIVRVLHGARDIQGILAEEVGIEEAGDHEPGEGKE